MEFIEIEGNGLAHILKYLGAFYLPATAMTEQWPSG